VFVKNTVSVNFLSERVLRGQQGSGRYGGLIV